MSTFISAARKMGLWYGLLIAAALGSIPMVASATTIGNSITVTNDATISGNVTTTNVTSSGYMDIGGKLGNSNASYTNGDLNVGNRLAVDGATYVSSTMDVTGNSRFYGTLTVDGVSTFSNSVSSTIVTSSRHLGVGSIVSLSQRWTNGDANFGGQILVDGSVLVSSTLQVTSLATLYGGFISSASSSIGSSLNVSGNLNASSTVFIGGNILPGTNNSRDLGGAGAAMRDLFVSSSLTIGTPSTTASSTALVGMLSTLSGGIDFVDVASTTMKCTDTSNIGAGGSDVTVTGTLVGDYVTVAPTVWDNAFSSGTLRAFVADMNKVRIVYCGSGHDVTSQDRDPVTQRYRVTVWKF